MRRHLIHLIAALLLALLVFADEGVRVKEEREVVVDGQAEEQQQVLDVDVPPEVGPDGESHESERRFATVLSGLFLFDSRGFAAMCLVGY